MRSGKSDGQAYGLPEAWMVSNPINKTLPETIPEVTASPPASGHPTSSLAEVVERNLHVRAIRQLAHQTAAPPEERIVRTAHPRTIVVVDDEPDLVELTVMILEAAGHRAHGAIRSEAAFALAVEYTPDVLLMDYMMPNKNGGELGKAVRSLPALRRTTIVIISGTSEATVRGEFDQFDLFLTKPVHPDQLLRMLEDLVTL